MGCLIGQPDRRCVDWRARAERAAFYVRGLEELAAVPSIGRAARIDGGLPPEADLTHALYEQYANQIFRYCLHQLGSREEAEDAVQSTFLNAFRGIKRGVVPELESAWLFKIAQNVCLSRRRTTWRRGRIESPTDFEVVEELAPAPSRQSDELIGLQDVLERLPENQRRAILLREWQGLSYREIAAELELSQAAVETLIFRARRALASGLEQPSTAKRRVVRGADFGNVLAAVKSLLLGGGAAAKVAATVAVVSAGTVVAAAPVQQHRAHSRAAPTHTKTAVKHAAARHAAAPATHRDLPRVAPHEAAVPVHGSHVPARARVHASAVVAQAHVRHSSPVDPRAAGSPDDRAVAPPAVDSGDADPTPATPASPPAAPQGDTGHTEVQQTPPPPATASSDAAKKDTTAAGQKGPGDAKKSDSDHRTSGSPDGTTTTTASPPVVRTAPVVLTVKTTQLQAEAGVQLSPRTAAQYPSVAGQSPANGSTGSSASPGTQSGASAAKPATPAVTAPAVTTPAVTAPAVTTPAPAPATTPAPVVARPTTTTQPAPVVSSAGLRLSSGSTSTGRTRRATGS
jgi:RNA polymerase sigma factor (sigma-70 family)